MSTSRDDDGEAIESVCSCSACRAPLPEKPYGAVKAGVHGAYCSSLCAGHAGGPWYLAKHEHRWWDS